VHLSTHYYVLSLGGETNSLYECFRDYVIDVHNAGFPVEPAAPIHDRDDDEGQLRDLLRTVDRRFGKHYQQDPLGLVVIGESTIQSAFASLTVHEEAIVGRVDGDYAGTSPHDVGKIVWPVVKEAMSGLEGDAMRDLEIANLAKKTAIGIDAVSRDLEVGGANTLLVEEDYHVPGSLWRTDGTSMISTEVDIREAIDDVVDIVIEKVLETGGRVFFLRSGSLNKHKKIALILSGTEQIA